MTKNWPENLSEKDKEIISAVADDNKKFAFVYSKAKKLASSVNILNNMNKADFLNTIVEWSKDLETSYYVSDDVMNNITSAIASKNLGADEIFIEFQKIKPFKEHNDFIGDIIWRLIKTRNNGVWPETRPADTIINTQWKQQN